MDKFKSAVNIKGAENLAQKRPSDYSQVKKKYVVTYFVVICIGIFIYSKQGFLNV